MLVVAIRLGCRGGGIWRSEGIAKLFPNLVNRVRWLVTFVPWLLQPLVPIEQKAGWVPSCDLDGMEKTALPVLGIDARFLVRRVRSVVTYTFYAILAHRLTYCLPVRLFCIKSTFMLVNFRWQKVVQVRAGFYVHFAQDVLLMQALSRAVFNACSNWFIDF